MKQCAICGKGAVRGHRITKRGMPKKQGGVGRRNVRVNDRMFYRNLQRMAILLEGTVQRVKVCTTCLKAGRVVKAPLRASRPAAPAPTPQ